MNFETLNFGVFFDGTGNNGYNLESKKNLIEEPSWSLSKLSALKILKNLTKNKNASYLSSSTNIYRLYNNYKFTSNDKQFAIYISGIGTDDFHDDNLLSSAIGVNKLSSRTSAYEKIEIAAQLLYADLVYYLKYNKTTEIEIQLDIYGFSRGAALARLFALEIMKVDFKKKLTESIENVNINININFIGLFDTVKSIINFNRAYHNLSLENIEANYIFQIAAVHECRKNFPLNTIIPNHKGSVEEIAKEVLENGCKSIKVKNSKGTICHEIYVPGAHSDIGGGYLDNIVNGFKYNKGIEGNFLWKDILFDKKCNTKPLPAFKKGQLQYVYLYIMANMALQKANVNFNVDRLKDVHNYESTISNKTFKKNSIDSTYRHSPKFLKFCFFRKVDYFLNTNTYIEEINPLRSLYIKLLNDLSIDSELEIDKSNTINNTILFQNFIHISANSIIYKELNEGNKLQQTYENDNNEKVKFTDIHDIFPNKPTSNWFRKII